MQRQLAQYYYQTAVEKAIANQLTDATKLLDQSVVLNRELWQAWNVLGLCCYRLGDFSRAKEAWKQSCQLKPQQNPAEEYRATFQSPVFIQIQDRYSSALVSAQDGKYSAARKTLSGEDFPAGEFVHFSNLLGLCHWADGKIHLAFETWRNALQLDITNPLTLYYLREATVPQKQRVPFAKFWQGLKMFFSERWGFSCPFRSDSNPYPAAAKEDSP
jgi:Flp pilus assembly protein TadD